MRTFKIGINNDLELGPDGMLQQITGIEADSQTAQQFMQARRGEMIHKANEGIPFYDVAFGSSPNIAQFEAAGRATLLLSPNVIEVINFDASQDGDVLTYTATIRTENGEAVING